MIRLSGGDDSVLAVDWSADRAGDPLDDPVRRLIKEGTGEASHG
jgi:hypothetical protein